MAVPGITAIIPLVIMVVIAGSAVTRFPDRKLLTATMFSRLEVSSARWQCRRAAGTGTLGSLRP